MLRFVDMASFQGVPDFQALRDAGIEGVCIKATGGTWYTNELYRQQLAGARAVGMLIEHYHYAFEGLTASDPAAEVAYFASVADVQPGETIALDFEEPLAGGDLSGWALSWLEEAERRLGRTAHFYASTAYIYEHSLGTAALSRFPLWLAFYWDSGRNTPVPPTPGRWPRLSAWQWSGGHPVATLANVDEDIFFGTREDWLALGGLTQERPEAATDGRTRLLAYGEAIPFEYRGSLTREGVADLREFRGGEEERLAVYERLVAHLLNGEPHVLTLGLWDDLRHRGRIILY